MIKNNNHYFINIKKLIWIDFWIFFFIQMWKSFKMLLIKLIYHYILILQLIHIFHSMRYIYNLIIIVFMTNKILFLHKYLYSNYYLFYSILFHINNNLIIIQSLNSFIQSISVYNIIHIINEFSSIFLMILKIISVT
jgi:hypothetical protein